jgi:hypothetical protein
VGRRSGGALPTHTQRSVAISSNLPREVHRKLKAIGAAEATTTATSEQSSPTTMAQKLQFMVELKNTREFFLGFSRDVSERV